MSVIKLNKFQSKEFTGWAGMTKDNHLASLGLLEPQKLSDVMVQLYASQYGGNLFSLLNSLPKREFNDDSEYYWDAVGSARRNIALVKAETIDGTSVDTSSTAGANVCPFYLYFGEYYFAKGEVIYGDYYEYPVRILEEPQNFGTLVRYKVELINGSYNGMPGEMLQPGALFSVGFAPVSRELSREAGDIRFSTPVQMRNEWTTIRLKHKVPGNKFDRKIAFGIPLVKEENGKLVKTTDNRWIHYIDWVFEKQWQEYKSTALAWGMSNRLANGEYLNFDPSGEVIRMGDGLFAQMKRGNNIYYNTFSLKVVEDALYDILQGKQGFSGRTVVMRTGMKGAQLFNKAVKEDVSGWTMFNINAEQLGVVAKTSSDIHPNALKAGFMFTEYVTPFGLTIKVEVDPMYDDPVMNKVSHPLGGPASSYRFDILDLGGVDEPNIFLCSIKGQNEVRGYEPGLRNPFTGEVNIQYMSNDEDACKIHRMTSFGVAVLDPTRTMSIVPNILAV